MFLGMTSAFLAESCQDDRPISKLRKLHSKYTQCGTTLRHYRKRCERLSLRAPAHERPRYLRRDTQTLEPGEIALVYKSVAFSECNWSMDRLWESVPKQLFIDKRTSRYLSNNWRIYCITKISRNTEAAGHLLHVGLSAIHSFGHTVDL